MIEIRNDCFDTLKNLYESLADEESRMIFRQRLQYSLTGNKEHLIDMFKLDKCYHKKNKNSIGLWEFRKGSESKYSGKKVYIYGACPTGHDLFYFWYDINFEAFVDKSIEKQQKGFCGVPVISPEVLRAKKDEAYVVIGSSIYHYDSIESDLKQMGFSDGQIIAPLFRNHQYFDKEIIKQRIDAVLVDCGAYDLQTALDFASLYTYKKIFSLEPDRDNYKLASKRLEVNHIQGVSILNIGAWNEKTTLSFVADGTANATISDLGEDIIEVDSIDNILKGERATLIKMDYRRC